MRLTVVALTHRPDGWVQEALDMYARRFPPDWKPVLIELKPEPRDQGKTTEQILALEAKRIRAHIPPQALCIALDERGRDLTTRQVADTLSTWHDVGDSVCWLIGSADGLHVDLKADCRQQWRLSSLTLPHALARVVLLESLYRAWSLLTGHPYHRE